MLLASACTTDALLSRDPLSSLPNGVATGEVDQTSVVLWARITATGPATFTVVTDSDPESIQIPAMVTDPMRPVTVTVADLTPATAYRYTVESSDGQRAKGVFRTGAMPEAFHGLQFGVSGDWRGSLAPFVAMRNAPARDLDFFVALGDTIYADLPSPALQKPRAESLADFRLKHAEVYSTRMGLNTLADLRASTPVFATVDDHEILNDIAGGAQAVDDPRIPETSGRINRSTLYGNALQVFQEYNPIRQEQYGIVGGDGRMDDAPRLYRYRLFGRDAALFLLDARSFRDSAGAPCRPQRSRRRGPLSRRHVPR